MSSSLFFRAGRSPLGAPAPSGGRDSARGAALVRVAAALPIAAALFLPSGAVGQLAGGAYWMVGQTTGGGGRSESATWSIAGSVAVPICAVSQGGAYELNGGLVGNYPIPAEGTRVTIERADATQLRVVFTGTLQTAESPVGPWVDIVAAVSPFAVSPSEGARYYRSRQ